MSRSIQTISTPPNPSSRMGVSLLELLVVTLIIAILSLALIDLKTVTVARSRESQMNADLLEMRQAIKAFQEDLIPQINDGINGNISSMLATAAPYLRPQPSGTPGLYNILNGMLPAIPNGATYAVTILPSVLLTGSWPYYIKIPGITTAWKATMSRYLRRYPLNPFPGASYTGLYVGSGGAGIGPVKVFGLTQVKPANITGNSLNGVLLGDL